MSKKAIIIGAGIAGIASAIRLSSKGYKVKVYEKNKKLGGKLTDFQLGDYRFDFGPSLFTMPQYVEELFTLHNKNSSDYFEYIETDIACKYFYKDQTQFSAYTDEAKFIAEAVATFDVSRNDLQKFMHTNKKIFENAAGVFLENSLHKMKTWLSKDVLKSLTHAYVFDLMKSMHKVTSRELSDEKLVQFFDRYATYNGSNPYKASSILNSISSLEHDYGTYFPVGGMSNITGSLVKLAKELGVDFHTESTVEEILYERKRVKGVKVKGQAENADIIVSNMDVKFTYEKLLGQKNTKKLDRREKSSSAVIFYWGINRKFDKLGLHNILFSEDYRKEFNEIFNQHVPPSNPTVYINISSKYSQTDAPQNGENWFVMVNVPADFGQDWDAAIIALKKSIQRTIDQRLSCDIKSHIVEEFVADPRTIRDKTLSHRGALYGSSSNHWLSAFLRHPNFTNKIEGLYFVGGTVHPGGGIPLCLLSAKIMSEIV
ncbi:phytoene desaturase family protein [Saprospiraceae bacterium]|nr:phytoene desaturase family protein [Saprospiraceae bacterium]